MAELTGALIVPIDNVKKKCAHVARKMCFASIFEPFCSVWVGRKAGIEGSSGFNAPFDMRSRIN